MARQHSIDRASTDDVMSLVSDRGDPPLHVGAVLLLDAREGLDPTQLKHVLAQRLASIPRLRQRLIRVPIGCGRPVWVDYAGFQVHDHFSVVRCTGMRDEEAVLGIAAELLTTRLPHDRPLWAATLVTGVLPDQAALVFVFHHVLADGIAGLAVLGSLVDGGAGRPDADFPRPGHSVASLALDAVRDRFRSVLRLPAAVRRLASAMIELGPTLRTHAVPCSLNRPTGPNRRLHTVRADLNPILSFAHEHTATVNDVVLTAITGALHRLLAERGEQVPAFVVSIPVSSRTEAEVTDLGNQSGVMPLHLPQPVPSISASHPSLESPGRPRASSAEPPRPCWDPSSASSPEWGSINASSTTNG